MFEAINGAADSVAAKIGVSRREFLDRLARAAMATAGALGGLLALPRQSQAAVHRGFCQVVGLGRPPAFYYSGICVESGTCLQAVACTKGWAQQGKNVQRFGCAGSWTLVDANRPCAF